VKEACQHNAATLAKDWGSSVFKTLQKNEKQISKYTP
jgi:hypothetical protein